ncbi:hypothetical protein AX15_006280 [Amanita polypyramis BW_CC]|nr:hypothetical protein AX15_006280 [Amanita polypyramis BW_CC]
MPGQTFDGAGDSFLPRIQSVFYAVFDVRQGPKIVYQVPEGLIAVSSTGLTLPIGSVPATPSDTPSSAGSGLSSRGSRTSLTSPEPDGLGRSLSSLQRPQPSTANTLFNFDEISKYVIPPPALCGRLVTCSTKRYRIIGFPIELKGKYQRNYFRYNLCFVFDRGADLSCYDPIIRKISRVLTSCEEESGFLSSGDTSPALHAILEQLYEDLNSYAETSIAVDQFNSIELKIFPYYPNPPSVRDWMVPVALIRLGRLVEDNWDLTMVKVCRFIDGVNHVSRIAQLAECDIELTRLAIAHLLYYQVIMTIDIFQFSNVYMLRKSIQWLENEPHVRDECGPYITKPGRSIPDWPQLLHLYSRLKPGTTVLEWMQMHDVSRLGIDARRFISFGVIKGFLRRVHRWPVLLDPVQTTSTPEEMNNTAQTTTADTHGFPRRRGKSLSNTNYSVPGHHGVVPTDIQSSEQSTLRGRPTPTVAPIGMGVQVPMQDTSQPPANSITTSSVANINASSKQRARRASAAEKVLEQVRNKDLQRTSGSTSTSPRTTWLHKPKEEATRSRAVSMLANVAATTGANITDHHLATGASQGGVTKIAKATSEPRQPTFTLPVVPPPSPVNQKAQLPPIRPRLSRSPSAPHLAPQQQTVTSVITQAGSYTRPAPRELIALLDGSHHTDELSVRFEAGWPLLEQWLTTIGGGPGSGDYGHISIIYK